MAPLLINPISTTDENADSLTERLKDLKAKSTKKSQVEALTVVPDVLLMILS